MKKKKELDTTSNSTVYDRLKRYELRCSFCRPHRGENKTRWNNRCWKIYRKKRYKNSAGG